MHSEAKGGVRSQINRIRPNYDFQSRRSVPIEVLGVAHMQPRAELGLFLCAIGVIINYIFGPDSQCCAMRIISQVLPWPCSGRFIYHFTIVIAPFKKVLIFSLKRCNLVLDF